MNFFSFLLISLIYFKATAAHATDYLMVIGAGGEATTKEDKDSKKIIPKNDTLFDGAIKNIGNYLTSNPQIKAEVALDGNHKITKEIIKESFPKNINATDFQKSDYLRLIQSYKEKLLSDEMKSGDQFMIYINSHGAEKNRDNKLKAHAIATSEGNTTDLNNLQGATTVELSDLIELRNLAKSKHVKMAIIDASCHSGNSLDLADNNTCVISSTGPNHYGYAAFSEKFSAGMMKGKNLEDLFLETRENDSTSGLPMISTKSGLNINTAIYEKITPFLFHFDDTNDKLTPYLEKNSSVHDQCIADKNFSSLMKTINVIEELNSSTKKIIFVELTTKAVDLRRLKMLLADYKKSLDLARKKMDQLNLKRLDKKETIFIDPSLGKFNKPSISYTWRQLLTMKFDELTRDVQTRLKHEKDQKEIQSLKGLLSIYSQSRTKRDVLIKSHADLALIPMKEKEISDLIDTSYAKNKEIATEERKLYSALYKESKKNLKEDSNPCRDFHL